ncbi:TPA: hypothetical protein ACNH4A_001699 [Klebsiella pneumoniae]
MTDITELAQREKFEAWWEREYKHLESSKYTDAVPHIKYGFWMAYQAGGAELVEALEKAQQRITQMESRTVTDWIEHDGKWRPESLGLDELVYLKTRKQELKIPYPAGKVKGWMNTGGDMDVMAYKLASPQASTVTVKLPPKIERDYVDGWFSHKGGLVGGRAAEWYNKALDDVIAELAAQGIKVEAE